MHGRTVQFGKNTVTKTAAPNRMRVEVEKTRRARVIALDCGLFRVPEVLEYDEERGVAVFERIHGIHPARELVDGSGKHRSCVERIGRSLAVIHRELVLPDRMTIALPPDLDLPGTEVYLHGDFNGSNVNVGTGSAEIVILDWQMTSQHGGRATYGSRFFDLIWFVNYLLWTPTFRYLLSDPVSRIARRLVEAYFEEADLPYDAEAVVHYARDFFDARQPSRYRQASRRDHYLLPRSRVLTRRFIASLEIPARKAHALRG